MSFLFYSNVNQLIAEIVTENLFPTTYQLFIK